MIAFGSFLLLAGRLGDLLGRKRMFLTGLVVFTLASVACGLADSQVLLIVRPVRPGPRRRGGVGRGAGAAGDRVPEATERAIAMSVYTFIVVSGGSIGLLAGGVLTQAVNWHWIFFINVPIGIITFMLGRVLINETERQGLGQQRRRARRAAGHGRADARRLRDRQGHRVRLAVGRTRSASAAHRWRCSACSWRSSRGSSNPMFPLRDPPRPGPRGLERGAGLPGHRNVLDLPARGALPPARARLRRARDRACLPAADADPGHALARDHRPADGAVRSRCGCCSSGWWRSPARSRCSRNCRRTPSYFPDDLRAVRAARAGRRAVVPAAD